MENILKVHIVQIRYGKYGDGIINTLKYEYNGKECYSVIIHRVGHYFYYGDKAKEKAEQVYREYRDFKKKSEGSFFWVYSTCDDVLGDIYKYIESLDVNKQKKKINMLKFLAK